MASLTQWTWVWAAPGDGEGPGRLQSIQTQKVRHDWATEMNWIESNFNHQRLILGVLELHVNGIVNCILFWVWILFLSMYIRSIHNVVFPVVMYVCESWTIKNVEHWRIDAFELWCWRRLLRVPWTARRYNQCILKEISAECSLEGLFLKVKLQYFGHLMWRTDSLEKTLMLGKIEGRRGGQQSMRWWMASPIQ